MAAKNSVALTRNSGGKFSWKWAKGTVPLKRNDFGDPVNGGTSYTACVYDQTGGPPAVFEMAQTTYAGNAWKLVRDTGFAYKIKTGSGDGITKIVIKGGAAGKPSIKLIGRGSLLAMPPPVSGTRFFHQDPTVIVQLFRNDALSCWSGTFDASSTQRNDGEQFKATTP